jgi:hypothetical protein
VCFAVTELLSKNFQFRIVYKMMLYQKCFVILLYDMPSGMNKGNSMGWKGTI